MLQREDKNRILKRVLRGTLGVMALSVVTACSSARINFQSAPAPAEVWVAPVGSKDLKQLGSTPISVSSSELSEKAGASGPVSVEYRSLGYATQRAVITDFTNSDLTLSLELSTQADAEEQDRVNRLVDMLFEAQRLARGGRNEEALNRVKEIQKEAPYVAAAYEIEAGIYLIQKKSNESLDAYRRAAKLNPKSLEIANMRQQVEKMVTGGNTGAANPAPAASPAPAANPAAGGN